MAKENKYSTSPKEGISEIPENEFRKFKTTVREEIDRPMLEEIFPLGTKLKGLWWESRDGRIRLPEHLSEEKYRDSSKHGEPGITFGRQIGAYPNPSKGPICYPPRIELRYHSYWTWNEKYLGNRVWPRH